MGHQVGSGCNAVRRPHNMLYEHLADQHSFELMRHLFEVVPTLHVAHSS